MVAFLLFLPGWARAQPADQRVVFGLLPCAGANFDRPGGIRQLVWELVKRTSVEADADARPVDPADPQLFRTPFLLWSCPGPVATLSERQVAGLAAFLKNGGFLWADDPSASGTGPFADSLRQQLQRVLPGQQWRNVPVEHVLYKTFFLIKRPLGRRAGAPRQALVIDERLVVLFTGGDLLGAMSRDLTGQWDFNCQPAGEVQREESFRLAINIVMYSLCLDYKNDRVHLPFIMRRRRL